MEIRVLSLITHKPIHSLMKYLYIYIYTVYISTQLLCMEYVASTESRNMISNSQCSNAHAHIPISCK